MKLHDYIPAGSLSASHSGAANISLVSSDLIRRGYPLFRSALPHAGCDLVILDDDGRAVRIDVQSGYRRSDGTFSPPAGAMDGRADIFALVCKGEIEYVSCNGLGDDIAGRTEP